MNLDLIRSAIRTIPDYPKPGIMFRDITTLLGNASAFHASIEALYLSCKEIQFDKVAGIEARGFIIGGALAHRLNLGFVPIRKKGKLPHQIISQSYELEYGTDEIEIHKDAISPGERVLLVDDLIASGGTALGAIKLINATGGITGAARFIVNLPDLGGSSHLSEMCISNQSLVTFSGE